MPGLPPNTLFSVFAFIGFILTGIPLPWHVQSRNMGSSMFMLWTSFGCLILFINSIIWNNNIINSAPVWCDICAHYLIGASVGIPASSLCIIRRLYYITKLQTIFVEKAQRRREIMVDISIGFGFPCVVMALQYIVQSHRFAIYEQVGCYHTIENTPIAYPLLVMWPLLIGSISLVYAVLTFRRAFLQREHSRKILHEGFSINSGYYWRLMALCCSEILFTVPLSIYTIIIDAVIGQPTPYVPWTAIHADFSQIPQYPTVVWKSVSESAIGVESERWEYVLCAFIIFAFFGWAREVRGFYSRMFWFICRRLKKQPWTSLSIAVSRSTKRSSTRTGKSMLPVHNVAQEMGSRRVSVPFRTLAKRDSSETYLSFEPTLNVYAHHTHICSVSMPATPEPAFARDRPSFDVVQLA